MTDRKVAEFFNMPERTYSRFKKADANSWRKKVYYLMLEETIRIKKLEAYNRKG